MSDSEGEDEFHDAEESQLNAGDEPDDDADEQDDTPKVRASDCAIATGVDEHGLPTGLPYTAEEIRNGFGLFFDNKQTEAERFFANFKDSIPLFSLGYATMALVRAIMSFEATDIQNAMKYLSETEALAYAATAQESTFASITRFVLRTKKEALTSERVHNTVITAEARMQTGLLQFFQESIMGFIKGGMNIRGAWKIYEKMWAVYKEKEVPLDTETKGAIQFGIGMFNLINSILPPKMLKLVSILGFPSNREVALRELNNCHDGGGVRSPVAAMVLLTYHVVIQSFFGFETEHHVQIAERILARCFSKYPDGGLFLFISGRLQRLKRDIPTAIVEFERAVEAHRDWKQLQHLCFYELGWCHFFSRNWKESEKYFAKLSDENEWSKAFFAYMRALCFLELGDKASALAHFASVPKLVKRKFGGKTISVEQYIVRKVKEYVNIEEETVSLVLPSQEMVYLWNGFSQISKDLCQEHLNELNTWTADPANATAMQSPDVINVTRLLRAVFLKESGSFPLNQSPIVALLEEIDQDEDNILSEKWIIPHARYEHSALLIISKSDDKLARKKLVSAQQFNEDYNFEMRLRLRMHLTWDHLKGMEDTDDD